MRQLIKNFLCVLMLAAGLQSSWGFALLGPTANGGDSWQTPVIGYSLAYVDNGYPGGPVFLGDIGGPKNIGEEYRRNVSVLYYAYNANFLGFFGSNGVAAADSAFGIMNSLTNVDNYSADLSEFPLQAMHSNPQATALYLTDVESATLHLLVEQLGLAQPERFTWTLHERYLIPGTTCPLGELYLVVQRNFDIINSPQSQLQYSTYVNNVLYTYQILEACTGPNPLAITLPFSVDPLAEQYTAVAANNADNFGGLQIGNYYTGLTRDDVAGLRYLMTTNNINRENVAAGSQQLTITTNLDAQQLYPVNPNYPSGFGTFDLGSLISYSRTNSPAAVATNFPGVIVATSSNYFILATNAVVTSYYTNYYGEPAGSPPHLKVSTNYTYFPQTIYVTTFANIVTNRYNQNSAVTIQTINVAPQNGAPIGSPLKTNVTTKVVIQTNVPSGDYTILSADNCPVKYLYTIQTNVFATTNLITSASTNVVTTNVNNTVSYTQSSITYFTNFIYVVNPVTCAQITPPPGLYQGIKKVNFVKANFDSLIGQFFQPVTNNYQMTVLVNSQLRVQNFQRVVTQPDILFTATDQAGANTFNGTVTRNINFDQTTVLPGLAGPGVINASTTFDFNKIGPTFRNGFLADLRGFLVPTTVDQTSQLETAAWGSFDGTTNAPVVYPNGASLANLANQVIVQISPTTLPNGTKGVTYPAFGFTATGGSFSAPFTWSIAGPGQLPPGLYLSSDGVVSGTPSQSGTYDFVVQLTDSLSRSVQWDYTIVIQ